MQNIFDTMKERGLIHQSIFEEDLHKLLAQEKVVCYAGFDPTAESLHIGHLVSILQLVRMQQAGHQPIALIGGATSRIGDPSFRNEMRPLMTDEQAQHNISCIKTQLMSFFDNDAANKLIVVNNDDWLGKIGYIEMLNTVGGFMSVNRMLSFDCFSQRMENGLSFLEFNYMPMQAYDFWYMFKKYNCILQLGGSDQWANILAGTEMVRKKEDASVFCITTPLLTNAEGKKMGKSLGGAVWLDRNKLSDYDFFQYMRNVDDAKVFEYFCMLTLLPLEEIKEICNVTGKDINSAKERLAFEVTKLVRGEENAKLATEKARAAFYGENLENMPEKTLNTNNLNIVDCLVDLKVVASRGEAKKIIASGGVRINEQVVDSIEFICPNEDFILKKGKKTIIKVRVK